MTRRKLVLLSFLVLFAGAGGELAASMAVPSISSAPPERADTTTVKLGSVVQHLRGMSSGEQRDQLRDWALYGALSNMQLDAETVAKATHNMAPLRLQYLGEMFVFDHGPGRRAILSGRRAVIVLDEDDPHPDATVARMADRIRMETGEPAENLEIFSYRADIPNSRLVLERRPPRRGSDPFEATAGYVAGRVKSAADLQTWLDSVDDVVYVDARGPAQNGVVLGGRRFANARTANLRLEDIAALYRSHRRIETDEWGGQRTAADPGFSLDPEPAPAQFRSALGKLVNDPCSLVHEAKAAEKILAQQPGLLEGPRAFEMASHEVSKTLAEIDPGACGIMRRLFASEIEELRSGLKGLDGNGDISFLFKVQASLPRRAASATPEQRPLVRAFGFLLYYVRFVGQRQCARYDGHLEGTGVGMNLFYTDLLAKLWLMDVHDSAPALTVPGFLSLGRMLTLPRYEEEAARLNGTRLWFGSKRESYSTSSEGDRLWFEHIATRVYAAGNDAANPGHEEQPAENSRRALSWWDQNYARVATHEPEYYVQNQIMKWSIIAGLLERNRRADYLMDAETIKVDDTQLFDEWLTRKGSALRYQHPVAFRPRSEWKEVDGKPVECLDLLASSINAITPYTGGVSLGGKRALQEAVKLKSDIPAALRHDIAETTEIGATVGRARPAVTGPTEVQVERLAGTRLRAGETEVRARSVSMGYEGTEAGRLAISMRSEDGTGVGQFRMYRTKEGMFLDWEPGDLEVARQLVETPGAWPSPGSVVSRGRIELPEEDLVALSSDDPSHAMAVWRRYGGQARQGDDVLVSASHYDGRLQMESKRLHTADLRAKMEGAEWQRLSPEGGSVAAGDPAAVTRRFSSSGPPPGSTKIVVRGGAGPDRDVDFFVTDDGAAFVKRPESGSRDWWLDLDQRARLSSRNLAELAQRARKGQSVVARGDLSSPHAFEAIQALGQDRPVAAQRALEALQQEPGSAPADQIKKDLIDLADRRLGEGDGQQAGKLYELYTAAFASDPDVLLRTALADLRAGSLDHAVATFDALDHSTSQPHTQQILTHLLDDKGRSAGSARVVQEWAAARAGLPGPIPPGLVEKVFLAADQTDIKTATRLGVNDRVRVLEGPERAAWVKNRAHGRIYLDKKFAFNNVDFEFEPHQNLAELSRSPTVQLLALDQLPTDRYAPGLLIAPDGKTEFRLTEAGAESPGGQPSKNGALLIRNCDRDGDGVLSSEEQRSCATL